MSTPEIILYTNRACPWAHRAHIALAELQLPFKEVTIDLDRPRDASYLAINPRGLVPTINYNGEIIPESGIVAQFLADQVCHGRPAMQLFLYHLNVISPRGSTLI